MDLKQFKQLSRKRSKRESRIKHSSFLHKPRKERQEVLDKKHEQSCQLWKIRRTSARETKGLIIETNARFYVMDNQADEFDDSKSTHSAIYKDCCDDYSFGDLYDQMILMRDDCSFASLEDYDEWDDWTDYYDREDDSDSDYSLVSEDSDRKYCLKSYSSRNG